MSGWIAAGVVVVVVVVVYLRLAAYVTRQGWRE